MKKTLLAGALIAVLSTTALSAEAFTWSSLNPFNWGRCCGGASSCECQKDKCNPCKTQKKCCPTKNPCQSEKPKCNTCAPQTTCNPCDRLQQETER